MQKNDVLVHRLLEVWYYRQSHRLPDSSGKRKGKPSLDYNWREIDKMILDLLNDFAKQGFKPTLRQLHYALVSLNVFPNLSKSYNSLSTHMTKRRHEGYFLMDCLSDDRHPIVNIEDVYYSPKAWMREYVNKLENLSINYHLNDKGFPRWMGQRNYVELWTEKQAMVSHLDQIVKKENLQVRIASFGGYPGDTELNDHIEERLKKKMDSGKNIYLLWFGDFDPSGESIDKTTFDRMSFDDQWELETYATRKNVEFKLIRVALTKEQIHENNLPYNIDRLNVEEQEKIQNDPRYKEFEMKHGNYACEVDSLPVINYQGFNDIVVRSVNQFFDNNVYQRGLDDHKERFPQREIDDSVYDYARLLLDELRVKIMWRWLESAALLPH
jgi:hypothetical protein